MIFGTLSFPITIDKVWQTDRQTDTVWQGDVQRSWWAWSWCSYGGSWRCSSRLAVSAGDVHSARSVSDEHRSACCCPTGSPSQHHPTTNGITIHTGRRAASVYAMVGCPSICLSRNGSPSQHHPTTNGITIHTGRIPASVCAMVRCPSVSLSIPDW